MIKRIKKLTLNENNDNIHRTMDGFKNGGMLTAVDKQVYDEVLEADNRVEEIKKDAIKDSKSFIPENPGTGKKVTLKPYTERLHRRHNRKFNEGWEDLDSYRDALYDIVEEAGEAEIKKIAQDLIYWCSESDIKRFMELRDYDLFYEDEE